MPAEKNHDLYDFMRQMSQEMASEYHRIQMRATEDPGTAGDQGEENWAELLREWLPRNFEVVTKGRIIGQDGATSPQVDVIVLSGSYPKKLLNKKLYLAAGVAAVFECKTTLKAEHVSEAVENCVKIKSIYPARVGTPYKELHAPIVYGLLAHSHSWKGEKSTPEQNVEETLRDADIKHVSHPRLMLDLTCVADLAAWTAQTMTFFGPCHLADWSKMADIYGPEGSATSAYIGHGHYNKGQVKHFSPIGTLISYLCQKLAWENEGMRPLADYYRITNISGSGRGRMRMWPSSIYSDEIRSRVVAGGLVSGEVWDEWHLAFM